MHSKSLPISPDDVVLKKEFPNEVIDAFNEMIAQNFHDEHAVVLQNELLALMKNKGLNRDEIFKKHWLDVEDIYRAQGWSVEYDKPAMDENYEPRFIFKKKRK